MDKPFRYKWDFWNFGCKSDIQDSSNFLFNLKDVSSKFVTTNKCYILKMLHAKNVSSKFVCQVNSLVNKCYILKMFHAESQKIFNTMIK
jgi:hypothetical protein